MTSKEARIIIECELTNMVGEYADREMPETIKRIYDALEVAEKAIDKQIPKKPHYITWANRRCPQCNLLLNWIGYPCRCGQAIDWSE